MKRDYLIELVRFLATCGIAIFHFEWIYLGHTVYFRHFYLWVEFFFVLSGFFLTKNVRSDSNEDKFGSIKYIKRQAVKLWKPYIIAFLFSFIVYCIINQIQGINHILSILFLAKWEIFFMQLTGYDLKAPMINGVTAYISALLGSSLVIHYLLKNHDRLLINILIPIAPIFIYSHIIYTYGNLSQWMAYENWYTIGLFRGIAGMLVGAGAYLYSEQKQVRGGIGKKDRMISLGIGCIAIVALVWYRNSLSYSDEILYPYIFGMILRSIYFRERKKVNTILEKVCLLLGKCSYHIFLIHYGVCYLLLRYMGGLQYSEIVPWYMIIIIGIGGIMSRIIL